jgi:hypothetical protein
VTDKEDDIARFERSARFYLETSAFNYFVDNHTLEELELTRAYQRSKGIVFVTSPMMLWEIMLSTDRQRADEMLLAAQALFDPILLGTPTELSIRYLRSAYGRDDVRYPIRSELEWAGFWPAMTRDFRRTLIYDFNDLKSKTQLFRDLSKNLPNIIENIPSNIEFVELVRVFVGDIHEAIYHDYVDDMEDEITFKFVILYVFILLLAYADIDGGAAKSFWLERGFTGDLQDAQVTRIFVDYPEIFLHGPLLGMAMMAALQYRAGKPNRGAIMDGMHTVYSPYVAAIVSNDAAFLQLAEQVPYYRNRLLHVSEIAVEQVRLDKKTYLDRSGWDDFLENSTEGE